jgi:hypothetical protein
MLVWFLYSVFESTLAAYTLAIAMVHHLTRRSIISDAFLIRIADVSFTTLVHSLDGLTLMLLNLAIRIVGHPQKPCACALRKSSSRSPRQVKLRMIPWKRGIMPRLCLLAFASNVQGHAQFKIRTERLKRSAINYAFTTSSKNIKNKYMRSDTDSYRINIDNCCTTSITPNIGDFVGPVIPVKNKFIRSFNGKGIPVAHRGTL